MKISGTNSTKSIGVLKLNTNFPRLKGDIGNPTSFRYPVHYITVHSAVPANITVAETLPLTLQNEFIAAAKDLVKNNVSVITTTCGFLSSMQPQLAKLSTTPVICSALELLPLLKSIHGGEDQIGVLTFNREALNAIHTAGVTPGAIEGLLPTDSLRQIISNDLDSINFDSALDNVKAACNRLLHNAAHTSAILLECTNLSPYKHHIRAHTGLPVYDIVDTVHWLLTARDTDYV